MGRWAMVAQVSKLLMIVHIEFLEPCCGGYFRYARATCCPAADSWATSGNCSAHSTSDSN